MECIAQGQVTGVTPYCAIVMSSSKGLLLDASKIKSAPIELKIGQGFVKNTINGNLEKISLPIA